jgi:hypothetical protein
MKTHNALLCVLIFIVLFGFGAMWDAQMQRVASCSVTNQESLGRNA